MEIARRKSDLCFECSCQLTDIIKHSRTFRRRPLKMSSLGGRIWKVVAYESLDHNTSKFSLLEYGNYRDPCANADAVFSKSQLKINNEKFPFLMLAGIR